MEQPPTVPYNMVVVMAMMRMKEMATMMMIPFLDQLTSKLIETNNHQNKRPGLTMRNQG